MSIGTKQKMKYKWQRNIFKMLNILCHRAMQSKTTFRLFFILSQSECQDLNKQILASAGLHVEKGECLSSQGTKESLKRAHL